MFGFSQEKKVLKEANKAATKVINKSEELKSLSDSELKARTEELREGIKSGYELDQLLIDAFATVREAARRALGLEAYKVQIVGAYILNLGDVAEMKTGEGKTLTSTMPIYLNALAGKGVHVITVNDYLVERDYAEIKKVMDFLGITVGLNARGLTPDEKRAAYACDVTYSTNSELGFDYLRDNMVIDMSQKVQRGHNFAIIDECDSVLIDEARTPLIISGGAKGNINLVQGVAAFVRNLKEEKHYRVDLEAKTTILNTSGATLAEKAFRINNLYDITHTELLHAINNALRAKAIMKRDVDYAVVGGEIVIIDTFTGRLMPGRTFSNGIHQALQAKEGLQVKLENFVVATITYQNYFRMYERLAGMTGTAKTEEEEFVEIFNMRVIEVPTNKPVVRKDYKDRMYLTKQDAINGLIVEIKERNEKGQPILVGTTSVESSELVSRSLKAAKIPHELLNAKNHHREADIIKNAGQQKAVTISTNMSGRGTDIKLGEGVEELGGLAVLAVERNEARRIDNQLRGRSGRQGDPGMSRFYLSMEDELMTRFNAASIAKGIAISGGVMESSIVSRTLSSLQKRIEGMNYDMRKNLVKYDDVLRMQREVIYKQRDSFIQSTNLENVINTMMLQSCKEIVETYTREIEKEYKVDVSTMLDRIQGKILRQDTFIEEDFIAKQPTDVVDMLYEAMKEQWKDIIEPIPDDVVTNICKKVLLQIYDKHWREHIDKLTKLRGGVGLQAYKQQDPLQMYIAESKKMFDKMKTQIINQVVGTILSLKIQAKPVK